MLSLNRLPSRKTIKLQAKRLRHLMAEHGSKLSHSQSLEWVTKLWGYPDWNTFNAILQAPRTPENLSVGDDVTGFYMGQKFIGKVLGIRTLGDNDAFSLTIHLREPIELTQSTEFTGTRQRITSTIGANGRTVQKMNDGTPHLQIDL